MIWDEVKGIQIDPPDYEELLAAMPETEINKMVASIDKYIAEMKENNLAFVQILQIAKYFILKV